MADYCSGGCGSNLRGDEQVVTLKFLREELLYDVKNYAYIEADVLGEDRQHAQHMLADIGEEGNVDRVSRILALVHASVADLLHPYAEIAHIEAVYEQPPEEDGQKPGKPSKPDSPGGGQPAASIDTLTNMDIEELMSRE